MSGSLLRDCPNGPSSSPAAVSILLLGVLRTKGVWLVPKVGRKRYGLWRKFSSPDGCWCHGSGGMGTEQVRGRKAGNSQPQIRAWGLKTEQGKGRASPSGGARAALGSDIFLYSCAGCSLCKRQVWVESHLWATPQALARSCIHLDEGHPFLIHAKAP